MELAKSVRSPIQASTKIMEISTTASAEFTTTMVRTILQPIRILDMVHTSRVPWSAMVQAMDPLEVLHLRPHSISINLSMIHLVNWLDGALFTICLEIHNRRMLTFNRTLGAHSHLGVSIHLTLVPPIHSYMTTTISSSCLLRAMKGVRAPNRLHHLPLRRTS